MSNQQVLLIGKIFQLCDKNKHQFQKLRSCGALHCGDQINAIDQKSFDGIPLSDANTILRSCIGDFCRIEVTPSNIILDQSNEIHAQSPINRALINENNRLAFYRTPPNPPMSTNSNNWTPRNHFQTNGRKPINKTRHNSISK
jgi:hypothetical protein